MFFLSAITDHLCSDKLYIFILILNFYIPEHSCQLVSNHVLMQEYDELIFKSYSVKMLF